MIINIIFSFFLKKNKTKRIPRYLSFYKTIDFIFSYINYLYKIIKKNI